MGQNILENKQSACSLFPSQRIYLKGTDGQTDRQLTDRVSLYPPFNFRWRGIIIDWKKLSIIQPDFAWFLWNWKQFLESYLFSGPQFLESYLFSGPQFLESYLFSGPQISIIPLD